MNETTNKPVDEVRIGRVKATIWRNNTEDGRHRYNVVFSRLYKDGDTWASTPSFGRNDLLVLAKVADLAHTRVLQLGVWGAMERKVRLATAVSGVSERPELAPSDRFRYGERVASQQVDVLVAER